MDMDLRGAFLIALGALALTACGQQGPSVDPSLLNDGVNSLEDRGVTGVRACTVATAQMCIEGDCGPLDDVISVTLDFDAGQLTSCSTTHDVCVDDQILGHEVEPPADILHLRLTQGVFSLPLEGGEAVGGFTHSNHVQRIAFTATGMCSLADVQ